MMGHNDHRDILDRTNLRRRHAPRVWEGLGAEQPAVFSPIARARRAPIDVRAGSEPLPFHLMSRRATSAKEIRTCLPDLQVELEQLVGRLIQLATAALAPSYGGSRTNGASRADARARTMRECYVLPTVALCTKADIATPTLHASLR